MNDTTNIVVALIVVHILAIWQWFINNFHLIMATEDATKKLKFSSGFFLQYIWYSSISCYFGGQIKG